MTDIALLWRPEQATPLRGRLPQNVRTVPLSQKSSAAALAAHLPNVEVRYFDCLRDLDLPALRAGAEAAVRAHEHEGGSTLDRVAVWHNAHEAGFVGAAAERLLAGFAGQTVFCAATPDEPEYIALAQACAARSLTLDTIAPGLVPSIAAPLVIAPDLQFTDDAHLSDARPWQLIVAVALSDLADQMRRTVAEGPVIVAIDRDASGDQPAIEALARALGQTRLLPLSTSGATYNERGDNTAYAVEVEGQLARVFARPPVRAIISDLRRVETNIAVRLAHACARRPILRAHGGGVMEAPYRFDHFDVVRSVWTHGARWLDHADFVACPRALRPPLPHRQARLALRASRLLSRPRLGVVVTTGELFAAPEAPLAPMIEAFGALCAAAGDADVILRLRRLEDSAEVWRASLPGAKFSVETRDNRPFIPFARACDLIVELGSESSAQFEAAANGVPYVRIDAPPSWLKRFLREGAVVPQLDVAEAVALLRSPLRRAALGLRQFRALERDTQPT